MSNNEQGISNFEGAVRPGEQAGRLRYVSQASRLLFWRIDANEEHIFS